MWYIWIEELPKRIQDGDCFLDDITNTKSLKQENRMSKKSYFVIYLILRTIITKSSQLVTVSQFKGKLSELNLFLKSWKFFILKNWERARTHIVHSQMVIVAYKLKKKKIVRAKSLWVKFWGFFIMNRPVDNAKQGIPEETDYVHVIDLSNVLTVDRLHPVQTTGSLYRPVLPLLHRHRKLVSLLLFLSWSICLSASLFPFSLPSVSVPLSVCLSVLLHPVQTQRSL